MGAARERQNKAERVISRETAGASGRLTQLTSLTSLTSTKASVPLRFVFFSQVSCRTRSPKGSRRPHISNFLCSSFIKFDVEPFFLTHQRESLGADSPPRCVDDITLASFTRPSSLGAGPSSSLSFNLLPPALLRSLPPLFPPSPCNKSQSVYNPSGAVHNSSGSNCSSIYIRQCRGLASLI